MVDFKVNVMKDKDGFFRDGQRENIINIGISETINPKKLLIKTPLEFKYITLFRLLWTSGRRVSEVLPLKVNDIDFINHKIRFKILKKRKRITEPITKKKYYVSDKNYFKWKDIDSRTLETIKHHIFISKLRKEDYLFYNTWNDKKPLSRQMVDLVLKKACKHIGIDYVGVKKPHCHHFRHSFSVDLAHRLKTPADLIKLKNALEHESIGTTEGYLQFSPEIKEELEDLYG